MGKGKTSVSVRGAAANSPALGRTDGRTGRSSLGGFSQIHVQCQCFHSKMTPVNRVNLGRLDNTADKGSLRLSHWKL